MADEKKDPNEPRKPQSDWYRVRGTDEVLPALKHPAGYEDDHPKEYEPCDAPESVKAAELAALEPPKPVAPAKPAVQTTPAAPAPTTPAAPAPQTPAQ